MNRTPPHRHRPGNRWIRWLRSAAGLLVVAGLAACGTSSSPEQPSAAAEPSLVTTLYVAFGVDRAELQDPKLQREFRRLGDELEASFQKLHPGVHLEQMAFEEDDMVAEIRRRTRAGLGPDLILVQGGTAERLYSQGLIRPLPFSSPTSSQLRPELIPYVKATPRQLFALPVSLQPQLACFDRRRIASPPATLQELLAESSRGKRFGLSLSTADGAWTMGSLGALESIHLALAGAPLAAEQTARISTWLGWLRTADLQQRITLVNDRNQLLAGLRSGELDWIPCQSNDVNALRLDLGQHLGLAPLPAGPAGPPTPISSVQVAALGRNSSGRQREAAEAMLSFLLSARIQRMLTIRNQAQLPASAKVSLPVASSANLAALLTAQDQAEAAQELTNSLIALRGKQKGPNRILSQFLYGSLDASEAAETLIQALRPDPVGRPR